MPERSLGKAWASMQPLRFPLRAVHGRPGCHAPREHCPDNQKKMLAECEPYSTTALGRIHTLRSAPNSTESLCQRFQKPQRIQRPRRTASRRLEGRRPPSSCCGHQARPARTARVLAQAGGISQPHSSPPERTARVSFSTFFSPGERSAPSLPINASRWHSN